jgi:acetylornithine deacetylase/succinyl-diaminopimelate desuccinylase-like protein
VSQAIDDYIRQHMPRWVEELTRLCAQPSVSARHEGIEPCARLVAELLRGRGFEAEVSPTDGHPVVIGRASGRNPNRTMLFYCHYDVQPPEPLELWQSPPFEPTVREGRLYARGAKDDKGELVARLAALDALRAVDGEYPCNLVFLVDGEEEIGSPSLAAWVERNRHRLRADGAIWEEGGTNAEGEPQAVLGARGMLYVELSVETLSRDAHSGGANLLPNANWRLVWALSSLKGPDERIRVPGFYDAVRPPSRRQEELIAALPSQDEAIKGQYGLERLLLGRSGLEARRAVFEPTCNVAGMGGGHQGPGAKTIVPARSSAKIDFRLLPDQDPEDLLAKLRRHLDAEGFADVRVEKLSGYRAGVTDPDAPLVRLMGETAEEVYGQPMRIVPFVGGTTPMYLFTDQGVPVINPGLGWGPFNQAHSPNEFVRLEDFERAARHVARILRRFAAT